MRQFAIRGVVSIFLLHVLMLQAAVPQQPKDPSPTSSVAFPSYPETSGGLKKLIEDIFGAVRSGNKENVSTYFSSLTIPDHDAWFTKTFGPTEGPRLEFRYREMLPQESGRLKNIFAYALKEKRTDVEINVLQKPAETTSGLGLAIIEAMVQPTSLYIAGGTSPKEKYPVAIGDFVCVDGGFRYIDTLVFQELSKAPPMRIRQGGSVQLAKLIHEVKPAYPNELKGLHPNHTVLLHVVLAIDGTPNEVTLVSGDPVFGKAAVDAVRQWRYKPTLLNGKPVEVETTISIEFQP